VDHDGYYLDGALGSEILYYYFVDCDEYYLDGALGPNSLFD
jgi:hypothetical protein